MVDRRSSTILVVLMLTVIQSSAWLAIFDETDQKNILRDPEMLERLNEIDKWIIREDTSKPHPLCAIDAFIKSTKNSKNIAFYQVVKTSCSIGNRTFILFVSTL